jgi:hypothetical protein
MSAPLEEEKRALLERMHASRKVYRSRFPSETHPEPEHNQVPPDPAPPITAAFPRSHTFRFVQRLIHRVRG